MADAATAQNRDKDAHISFAEAAAEVPGQPHEMTVRRWWSDGLQGGHGQIHLRAVKIGGRRFTTRRWLDEFFHQLRQANRS